MEKAVLRTLAKIVGGVDKLVELDRDIWRMRTYMAENPIVFKRINWKKYDRKS